MAAVQKQPFDEPGVTVSGSARAAVGVLSHLGQLCSAHRPLDINAANVGHRGHRKKGRLLIDAVPLGRFSSKVRAF